MGQDERLDLKEMLIEIKEFVFSHKDSSGPMNILDSMINRFANGYSSAENQSLTPDTREPIMFLTADSSSTFTLRPDVAPLRIGKGDNICTANAKSCSIATANMKAHGGTCY